MAGHVVRLEGAPLRIRMPSYRELQLFSNLTTEGKLVASVAVEIADRTVMYGCIRSLPELALFAPAGGSDRERVAALKEVFKEGRRVLRNIGQPEAILFADSEERAALFARHFGARSVDKVTMQIEV